MPGLHGLGKAPASTGRVGRPGAGAPLLDSTTEKSPERAVVVLPKASRQVTSTVR